MTGTNGHDRSLSELERDAERTRAELMTTVDALRRRVSPGALKEDAKDYIRHTGEGVLGGIQQRARENPLQAVAIAAGLAFPIWRMATSIPVPLMLIGAGLALGRAGSGQAPGESYGSELYQQARDKVQETAGAVRARLHDATDAVQQTLSSAAETVSSTAGQVTDQLSAGLSSAREHIGATVDSASSTASTLASEAAALPGQIYGRGAETAQDGMQRVQSGAGQARDAASRGAADMRARGERLQHDVMATMERNPLLVGMLGLAAGAVVAAAFPPTRVENRMFGETSDTMKARAQELASDGAAFARSTAGDLYDQALQEARAQGLSPEALRDAVRELADRTKTAARNATGSGHAAQPDLSTTH